MKRPSALLVLVVNSIEFDHHHGDNIEERHGDGVDSLQLSLGIAALLGGRIYGLVDSWISTGAYNRRLRANLGATALARRSRRPASNRCGARLRARAAPDVLRHSGAPAASERYLRVLYPRRKRA